MQDDFAPFDERGIKCGDGWFAIVDCLSRACENEIAMLISQGLDKECWPRVAQIKEEMGGLRFYVNEPVSDELRAKILQAEADEGESFRTCERCGAAGRLRGSSWRQAGSGVDWHEARLRLNQKLANPPKPVKPKPDASGA